MHSIFLGFWFGLAVKRVFLGFSGFWSADEFGLLLWFQTLPEH